MPDYTIIELSTGKCLILDDAGDVLWHAYDSRTALASVTHILNVWLKRC